MASISSINIMHGSIFFAAVKMALVRSDVSPTYFLNSVEGTIFIIGIFVFFDNACTSAVFPHPKGNGNFENIEGRNERK